MTEIILEFWPIILSTIGLIIWLVRIEGKVKTNERSVDILFDNKKEVEDVQSKILQSLSEMKNDLKWLKELGGSLIKSFTNEK